MNKKVSVSTTISIAALASVFAVVITYTAAIRIFDSRMSSVTERQTMYELMSEIDRTVRQNYYGEITENRLQNSLSDGYIDGIDDEYSEYLSPDEYQLAINEAVGYSFGLGMNLSKASDGRIQVNMVDDGSPAAKAGIVKGDTITAVAGKDVLSIGYSKSIALLNEAPTKISITVSHADGKTSYELTKAKYENTSVSRKMLDDKVGMITIYRFNAKTLSQFNSALSFLRNKGAKGVIIDLRDNSGVNYEYACDVLDVLLPSGELMSITDRNGNTSVKYKSDAKHIDMPVKLLINGQTEGAAELFAAVMTKFEAAETIGTSTAGHDTVQELFPLSNGGAVNITTAVWSESLEEYKANGAVVPMFEVTLSTYQQINRYLLADKDDPQLQTALDLIQSEILAKEAEEDEDNDDAESEASKSSETASTTTTASATSKTTSKKTAKKK